MVYIFLCVFIVVSLLNLHNIYNGLAGKDDNLFSSICLYLGQLFISFAAALIIFKFIRG